MQEKHLLHKVAVITGGGRGIGAEIAKAFARAGARVALLARTKAELMQAASDIQHETGEQAEIFAVNVSQEGEVRHAVDRVAEKLERIDVLVNAAAITGPMGPVETCDSAEWEKTIRINLLGMFYTIKAVLPHMRAQKSGAIINFAGGGAFNPRPNFSAYACSKAAVVRLTETLAEELKGTGITVNAISPGAVNTSMFGEMVAAGKDAVGEAQWKELEERRKSGGDSIENPVKLALFLASDKARGITGRTLSAKWDPWEKLPEHLEELQNSDIYTMRRIKPEDRGMKW